MLLIYLLDLFSKIDLDINKAQHCAVYNGSSVQLRRLWVTSIRRISRVDFKKQ